MKNKVINQLENVIAPFWMNIIDRENGGFYGLVDEKLVIHRDADKGCILHSRILWFFSNIYLTLGDDKYLEYASHCFDFIRDKCIDEENGGIFWSVTYDGRAADDTKHTYNQAFAIYALSSYYRASGNEEALKLAFLLKNIIETKCRDVGGYLEAFDVGFKPVANEKLSENGVEAARTMNTLLHVMEAYTELYDVSKDKKVYELLCEIISIWEKHIYNKEKGRQEVFFDLNYNSLIDLHSYGHDIETSWLIDRTLEVIGDEGMSERISRYSEILASETYLRAYREASLLNECENGSDDRKRIWWVQAESVVGFYNAYQKTGDEKYHEAAEAVLDTIIDKFVDKREGSEWFENLDENFVPDMTLPMVQPWKCPYHNGRMCIEIIKRL